jgi:hypothetical protein
MYVDFYMFFLGLNAISAEIFIAALVSRISFISGDDVMITFFLRFSTIFGEKGFFLKT